MVTAKIQKLEWEAKSQAKKQGVPQTVGHQISSCLRNLSSASMIPMWKIHTSERFKGLETEELYSSI